MAGMKVDWLGKCYYLREPYNIIPLYTLNWLADKKFVAIGDAENLSGRDVLDVNYIIVLNTDNLAMTGGDLERITEGVIHHELLHIKPDMDGIVQHNIKDFASILRRYGINWASGNFKSETEESGMESS